MSVKIDQKTAARFGPTLHKSVAQIAKSRAIMAKKMREEYELHLEGVDDWENKGHLNKKEAAATRKKLKEDFVRKLKKMGSEGYAMYRDSFVSTDW